MTIVLLGAVCLLSLLVFLYSWVQYSYSEKMRSLRALPTGLPTLPLLGHLHYIIFSTEGIQTAAISCLRQPRALQLRLFCVWIGHAPIVFINDPEDVQVILNKSNSVSDKSQLYRLLNFCMGDGLITAPVPIWKVTRRHLSPLFHPHNLEHLVPVFNKTSQQLVQQISNKVGHKSVDVDDDLLDFAIKNSLRIIFGSKLEGDIDESVLIKIKRSITLTAQLSGARVAKPWLRWDSVFYFMYNDQIENEINNVVYSLPVSVVKDIEQFESPLQQNPSNANLNGKEIQERNQKQVQNNDPLTLPEIYKTIRAEHLPLKKRDLLMEINTLFLAGTDTVSLTLSNCLLALSTYPDIQAKVYNEIIKEVGEKVAIVTSEDLTKLEYMDCVLKETMRRFTIIPYVVKTNKYDVKLGDYTIPAGSDIAINILGMHSNPRLFPDPDRFDPDRFRADNVAQRHKYSFLPFSGGPRDCIGKRQAFMSIKILLVHLLREYKVTTTTDINSLKFSFALLLTPKYPNKFSFEKRKKYI